MLKERLTSMGQQAKSAAVALAALSSDEKNQILLAMANGLQAEASIILKANEQDINAAHASDLSPALIDRLSLTQHRIDDIARGFRDIAAQDDPIGTVLSTLEKENGLVIEKMCVPIGVVGVIFESRPNVTADVSAICIKSGNAVILRGGKESLNTNRAIYQVLIQATAHTKFPAHAIQLIDFTDYEAVACLVKMPEYIDCIIPRGGEALINTVIELSTVPVIKHYKGLCHTYIDNAADIEMALAICENAKCQRPAVCNAMETLLVHKDVAAEFLPKLVKRLAAYHVEFRGDPLTLQYMTNCRIATEADWETEYLDLILSISVVENIEAAIVHINKFGSHHSDAIVTKSKLHQQLFLQQIDSAAVYVNASTRFTDGAEFGLGAEIGISTDKLHARGPMGVNELTTYKYIVHGDGQIRE